MITRLKATFGSNKSLNISESTGAIRKRNGASKQSKNTGHDQPSISFPDSITGVRPNILVTSPSTAISSTPDTSPKGPNRSSHTPGSLNLMQAYTTTPIGQSAGAALISEAPAIPDITITISDGELANYLDIVNSNIEQLALSSTNDPASTGNIMLRYKHLVESLEKADAIAVDKCNFNLTLRCSELHQKLKQYKEKWNLTSSGDSSLGFFHGWTSDIQEVNVPHTRTNDDSKNSTSDENRSGPNPSPLDERLTELEKKYSTMHTDIKQIKSDHMALTQRVTAIESLNLSTQLEDTSKVKDDMKILAGKLEEFESEFKKVNNGQSDDMKKAFFSLSQKMKTMKDNVATEMQNLRNDVEKFIMSNFGKGLELSNILPPQSHRNKVGESAQDQTNGWINLDGCYPSMTHQNKTTNSSNERGENMNDKSTAYLKDDYQGRMLKNMAKGLGSLITPNPSDTLSRCILQDTYSNKIPAVESQLKEARRCFSEYLKSESPDNDVCEEISDIIDDSTTWIERMRNLYFQKGCHQKSLGNRLYDNLPKFSKNSEMDVYEFLRKYEGISKEFDIEEERTELLYSKFLSTEIQEELACYKDDFASMKTALLHRYGDLKTITGNILLPLSKETLPKDPTNSTVALAYCRKLQFAFEKISKMLTSKDVPQSEVQEYVYSQDFMYTLLRYLPDRARDDFIKRLQSCNEDITRIRGKTAFVIMLDTVKQYYGTCDTKARADQLFEQQERPKKAKPPPQKLIHSATQNLDSSESDSDDPATRNTSVHFQQGGSKKVVKAEKPVSKHKFPCTVSGHKHDLSACQEFFSKSPKERIECRKQSNFKVCSLCLESNEVCTFKKCINRDSIPKVLICEECKETAKSKKRAGYNVLYCLSEKHTKPSNADITKALEDYIPSFKSSELRIPVNIAYHFQVLGGVKAKSKPNSLSRQANPKEAAPIFDTCSGGEVSPDPSDLVQEVDEDSIGVMQTLNIRGKPVLTLFDRGANQHLIDGKLAEELKIKVINEEPSPIGVISGSRVWTEYGLYQFYLGPTEQKKYLEITAQGISAITRDFPKYDLSDVNKEVLQTANIPADAILPPHIGGDKIGLLIGLKSVDLEPVCIFKLPSGFGLYRSPFKDMYGSQFCFGGPHKAISAINKRFGGGNINHLNVFFTQMLHQYRNSLYPSLALALEPEFLDSGYGVLQVKEPVLPYSFKTISGDHIYPTPMSKKDFVELGQDVDEDETCSLDHCDCSSIVNIFKARIPLSKQREFLDEDDISTGNDFRCNKCMRCKCATSNRSKMVSLAESMEQEAIEQSVHIDLDNKKVFVDLPFTKPPQEFLTKRHNDDNNYQQALKVYKSQCHQPEERKEGLRKVHEELVSRGFLKKLTDLPEEHQNLVDQSKFKHFMPWRTVMKESASTPVRIVVDPSMSGLNLILAKGENRLKRINDILLRARTKKYLWSSDISKLYNNLHLKPSSYAYQLFLYNNSLDKDEAPDIYVMVVAWYGVSSSSNQSLYALEELARLLRDEYPKAFIVLTEATFVDDMLSGCDSKVDRSNEIDEVNNVLDRGGFKAKYVVLSGEPSDEDEIKILGYRWTIVQDNLRPGFGELNFNKKKRGLKQSNPFPVVTPNDVSKLLSNTLITRRMVISKIAEIWDPIGLWEPYKFQLKLAAQSLNGMEWDTPLNNDHQLFWEARFQEFISIPNMLAPRHILPQSCQGPSRIRLLCLSDAAANAGGCAIYAGVKVSDDSYTCQLLCSKSKLMSETVPRNELEAIRLAANMAYDVKTALGDQVEELLFFTDSAIALSWCHNTKKKLRLFCLNRVAEIRRLLTSFSNNQEHIQLFHIDGKINPADLLTKPNSIRPEDIGCESIWMKGYPWMLKDFTSMTVTTYTDLQLSASQSHILNQECFPDVMLPSQINLIQESLFGKTESLFDSCLDQYSSIQTKSSVHSAAVARGKGSLALVDMIKHGYMKSISIVSRIIDFIWSLKHSIHKKQDVDSSPLCPKCVALSRSDHIEAEYVKVLKDEALNYYLRQESIRLSRVLPKEKLSKLHLNNGIYYNTGRLPEDAEVSTKDLDFSVFFDNTSIKSTLPVVSADSDIFYAYLMHVHHHIRKHAGNAVTLREIEKKFFPISNPNRLIQAVRKNCPRCRIILRRTLELEMGNHPKARYQIAPAFYNCMADIVYGFKAKPHGKARTQIKIYALVIVCLLSGATSILALEGIETQDIVIALERHSARHGIPSTIYVDMGTQLKALDKVEASIRDANLQLHESLGLNIIPSTAKSHEERGRVERKIRTLRDMLLRTVSNTDISMTALQWDSLFAKLASEIDDVPMARADGCTNKDFGWDLLTPNRFKLGRNNNRALEGPMILKGDLNPNQLLRKVQDIQKYWYQLLLDRLHHLIPRPLKWNLTDSFQLDDIVIFRFKDNSNPKLETWKVGRVIEIQNQGRRLLIAYPRKSPNGSTSLSSISRSPRDVSVISSADDIQLNSREFLLRASKIQ